MKDLTQQQMILLTLLVSFVTSIATAITIVSITTDTTPSLPATINRIVERTIQTVTSSTSTPTVIIQKETAPNTPSVQDQVVNAAQMNGLAMVQIFSLKTDTSDATFLGVGFGIDGGYVVTDKAALTDGTDFSVTFASKRSYDAKKVYEDKDGGQFALLQIAPKKDQPALARTASLSSSAAQLGQTVLSLGGTDGGTLGQGIISQVIKSDNGNSTSTPVSETKIISTIPLKASDAGGPLFGIEGKIIGVNIVATDGTKFTVPSSYILSAINDLQKPKTPTTPATP